MSEFNNFKKNSFYKYNSHNKYKNDNKYNKQYRYNKYQNKKEAEKNQEKNQEKDLELTNDECFPKLNNSDISINNNFDNIKFNILLENELNNSNNLSSTNTINEKYTNDGWFILSKKNLNTLKYKKEYSSSQSNKNTEIEGISHNYIYNCYRAMSINWNNYRDEQNYLYGDRSPFIDYKREIQKIVNEENQIMEEMYGNLNYISSDDEHNDYDDDLFHYK